MEAGFLNDEFLLSGETARALFHEVAEHAPIVDLHNHLPAAEIAGDRVYETLSDLWLGDDHYKWRAMRLAGFDERVVTGDADPWERFAAWAATVPRLIRNPLYVWSHLELRRVFGIDLVLSPSTAHEIWEEANRQLPGWSTQKLLSHFDVRVVATTDDPGDELAAHRQLAEQPGRPRLAMIPTFRPDGAHRLLDDPPPGTAGSIASRRRRGKRSTTSPPCSRRSHAPTRALPDSAHVRATTASGRSPTFLVTLPSPTP